MSDHATGAQLDGVLEAVLTWQAQHKAREMKFYSEALTRGELTVIPFKEFTKQKSRCDVCSEMQPAGIRRFWYRENAKGLLHCWWFHPCDKCWGELILSASLESLMVAQTQAEQPNSLYTTT